MSGSPRGQVRIVFSLPGRRHADKITIKPDSRYLAHELAAEALIVERWEIRVLHLQSNQYLVPLFHEILLRSNTRNKMIRENIWNSLEGQRLAGARLDVIDHIDEPE